MPTRKNVPGPGRFDLDLTPLHDFMKQMDSFFNNSFKQMNEQFHLKPFWVDVRENDSHFIVEADMHGYSRDQIQIETLGNQLHLRVDDSKVIDAEDTKQNTFQRRQSFQRKEQVISLPFEIPQEQIKANFKNHILTIKVPKRKNIIDID